MEEPREIKIGEERVQAQVHVTTEGVTFTSQDGRVYVVTAESLIQAGDHAALLAFANLVATDYLIQSQAGMARAVSELAAALRSRPAANVEDLMASATQTALRALADAGLVPKKGG